MATIEVRGQQAACKAILFDKDGTLLNFMGLWGSWAAVLTDLMERKLAELGSQGGFNKSTLLGLQTDERNRVIGYDKTGPVAMGTEEEIIALLASTLYAAGLPWNEAITAVRELNSAAMAELKRRREAVPLPGLRDFVQSCREAGVKLAVVTSDSTSEALEHLEWLGIRDAFTSVVGRDRVARGKPGPDMALLACRELGLSPGEAVVIGDSNADMQMGKRAGVVMNIGVAEEYGEEAQDAVVYLRDADVIISNYRELTIHP
ncbi:HAD family hydrolase [Paenibacillus barengoltzii]|mgnify:CR=1 FL=1|jgi:phosphoglycolate phosphatase|uniref:Phosphoglycolate phosphatase n=1 Tax=Paenibacillus barengoltzii J12 TaxID=935846 RepID=A0ABY1LSI5_9BACL|nr:HAD family hydrolase [Paenibacillus barengoltzii]SME92061.1 phosphoglycolate phosphatase [Paenibacillus barengoltzii J12]